MASAPAAFLDPAMLAGISDLALLARTVVDGFMHWQHRSIRKGSSSDFAEHRSYQPGDDLRRIDWRVFGRTDRFYVKEYEADTNASVTFMLDASGSMDFGSGPLTKFRYGQFLVASLAWLSQQQGDRVGLALFSKELTDVVPASTRHLQLLLHTLSRAKVGGPSQLVLAVDKMSHLTTRSGIIVLVTDCYESPEIIANSVGTMSSCSMSSMSPNAISRIRPQPRLKMRKVERVCRSVRKTCAGNIRSCSPIITPRCPRNWLTLVLTMCGCSPINHLIAHCTNISIADWRGAECADGIFVSCVSGGDGRAGVAADAAGPRRAADFHHSGQACR